MPANPRPSAEEIRQEITLMERFAWAIEEDGDPVHLRKVYVESMRLCLALLEERERFFLGLLRVRYEIQARTWLTQGRGPYEWDDDRYKDEAGWAMQAALSAIEQALTPTQEAPSE